MSKHTPPHHQQKLVHKSHASDVDVDVDDADIASDPPLPPITERVVHGSAVTLPGSSLSGPDVRSHTFFGTGTDPGQLTEDTPEALVDFWYATTHARFRTLPLAERKAKQTLIDLLTEWREHLAGSKKKKASHADDE